MNQLSDYSQATPESSWAQIQESNRYLTEKHAETERILAETILQMKDTDRQMKDTDRQMKETDKRIKRMEETFGSWANNFGFFAEEYFFNSFENGERNFFGEKFDEIEKNVKGIKKNFKDEYDILLINGKSIGIIEVKFKAHENDIPKILKKPETFRINFPEYNNHRVYLGLATMVFYPELEQECIKEGIAVVKQVGDMVVINDAHLKVF